ncbi:Nickel-binding periplasmic protein [Nocardia cerradoensis]|uniref:Nickel-binding periplasmic protein n=1 Tax=Nocardia cerradoensis TaxID=85688 RepID=A0A231GWD9_9NOCA|nr:ABC transporter substrate-binding protein [Nocardia cerradoensis]OXR40916.1 Nickel-binding periplasmic protein [Nocardia cerradoensis]
MSHRRIHRRPVALALALLTAVVVAGCATPARQVAVSDDNATPVPGGTLRFGVLDAPANLDPHSGSSYPESLITSNITDKLVYQNPKTGALEPWLATSWQYNDTLTQFTFHLRDDVTFSDGTKFTADSVKENFDLLGRGDQRLGIVPVTAYWVGYQGTEVVDPTTVRVSFDRPSAGFLQALSLYFSGIVAHSTLVLPKEQRSQAQNVVGTGPFTLAQHVYQQKTVLKKRPGYHWAPASRKHNGDAYLDAVEIDVIPEAGVRTGALRSGTVDAILDVNNTDEAPLQAQGYRIVPQLIPGRDISLDFKTDRFPTDDKAVRQAVQLGWSRDALVKTVLTPSYKVSSSVVSERVPGYVDFSADLREDQGKAEQILEADGWHKGADGIRVKDGRRLQLDLLGIDNLVNNKPAYQLIQQDLRKIGIDLQLNVLPIPDYTAASTQQGRWNIQVANQSRADISVLEQVYSPQYGNMAKLAPGSPEANEAVAKLSALSKTLDTAQRAKAAAEAQRYLLDEQVLTVPVYNPAQVTAAGAKVHNVGYEAQSRNVFYDTWIEQG